MQTIYVAAFRPNGEDGGAGGFNWSIHRSTAMSVFTENILDFDDSEHAFWVHETELTEPDEITTEIDDLEWGWFPDDRKHTATVWNGSVLKSGF